MTKKKSQKIVTSEQGFSVAGQAEWERLTENPEFLPDVKELQVKYAGPFQDENLHDVLERLSNDVVELCRKYGGTYYIYLVIHEMVASGSPGPVSLGLVQFPEIRQTNVQGTNYQELIITPDTDLTNPIVIDYILGWQRHQRRKPPMPIEYRKNPRKLDWRPVWEWEKRHPDVTRKDIAKLLGKNYVTVRRQMEELDKQSDFLDEK